MKHLDMIFSWSGSVFGTILTAIQTNEVFQYIQLALTILSTLVAIGFTIWKWWKKASQDGKIDEEEVKELEKDLKDALDDNEKGKKGEEDD